MNSLSIKIAVPSDGTKGICLEKPSCKGAGRLFVVAGRIVKDDIG